MSGLEVRLSHMPRNIKGLSTVEGKVPIANLQTDILALRVPVGRRFTNLTIQSARSNSL